jgi:uncharacterized protein YgbK (DUF1537 family)
MTPRRGGQAALIVLDDDPTGTQAVAETPVLLEWDEERLAAAAAHAPAVHLLTNSRALAPDRARAVVRDAVETAVAALGEPRLLLRGDSTLRAHLLEEYLAVAEARFGSRAVPLLLVPALPAAGRVTVGGVQLIERNGARIPLDETEYARDGGFAYTDASLLEWAEERSAGLLQRRLGREIHLGELRRTGARSVCEAIVERQGQQAVVAPDAETVADLETIAAGLRAAEVEHAEVVVRSAPTFAGVLAGNLARGHAAPPRGRRVLVVCGSHVPTTRRQLAVLVDRHPESLVEVDVVTLASARAEAEVERAAHAADACLDRSGLALLATPRERPAGTAGLEAGERIAENLARIAGAVEAPDVVVAKGGITSAVTARIGLGARSALCRGPLVDGVALWSLDRDGRQGLPFVVFPGNVGADSSLLEVVELVRTA